MVDFVGGCALSVAAFYSLMFLPLLPLGAIGIVYFGLGLLVWAPVCALIGVGAGLLALLLADAAFDNAIVKYRQNPLGKVVTWRDIADGRGRWDNFRGRTMRKIFGAVAALMLCHSAMAQRAEGPPTPTDVKPGSITCEDIPYPYDVSYLPLRLYGQDLRLAYMDAPAQGTPNGRTVVLFHGMNFAGFYWGGPMEALRKEGFRVVVVDQIGFGRSSKAIIPYNFHDMARNSKLLLDHLKISKAAIVGHSMGGMLAARFATQYPETTEQLVIYNPIGLNDGRFGRPWGSIDEAYERNLKTTYQNIYAGIHRYFAHNPSVWKPEYEKYVRYRYAWTLSGDWPRYAMVQSLIQQITYLDPVINDWANIKSPTLVFGGAEDITAGSAKVFQERMKFVADSIPNKKGKLLLIPGLGHVPHFEAPEKTYPPLIAWLKDFRPS